MFVSGSQVMLLPPLGVFSQVMDQFDYLFMIISVECL